MFETDLVHQEEGNEQRVTAQIHLDAFCQDNKKNVTIRHEPRVTCKDNTRFRPDLTLRVDAKKMVQKPSGPHQWTDTEFEERLR